MGRPGPEQMRFGVRNAKTPKAKFSLPKTPKEVSEPEGIYWADGMFTRTDVINSFSEGQGQTSDMVNSAMIVGSLVDTMVRIAKMIYGGRSWYCSDPEGHPEFSLAKRLPESYPTGGDFHPVLKLLEHWRPEFIKAAEGHRQFEKEEIKDKLYEVLKEVAVNFKLPELSHQSTMKSENHVLLPSGKTVTSEEVGALARRIIEKNFDTLVNTDPDYDSIFQPAVLTRMVLDGKTYHFYRRPDLIEVLKLDQKTTQGRMRKGQIVSQIIVGDFKNSRRELFEDPNSPMRRPVRAVQMIDEFIARKFDRSLLVRNMRQPGWNRDAFRGFLITGETPDYFPASQTATKFICFDEEGENMIVEMPKLSDKEKALAVQDVIDFARKVA